MLKDRIKQARLKAGLTQKEVAEKMGIQQPNYGQWERGIRNPKHETLEKLAKIFGTTTDTLKGHNNDLEDIINTLRKYDLTDKDKEHFCQYIDDYFKSKG